MNSPLAIFSVHRPGNSLLRNELEVGQCIPEARKAVRKNLASLERTGKLGGWDYKQHCFHNISVERDGALTSKAIHEYTPLVNR